MPDFSCTVNDSLNAFTCSVSDVIKVVRKLKNNSAPGLDNITPFFLKNVLAQIAQPLTKLFKVSLDEGVLPADWKTAYITPIFKKGDVQSASNYRPVSLTSVLCKILERIIREQMLTYLNRNNLLPQQQHGFLSKKSTVSNLLECMDKWTKTFDSKNSNQTDIIFLDFSKCFDTVCHSKLLFKLSKFGIKETAFKWIENFLTGRTQFVKINNALSSPKSVKSGVPQGSVLGPLLFLCFSSDLQNVVKYSTISVYADDTKLFKEIQNLTDCQLLQIDLQNISKWSNDWQLKLNPVKTKKLTIGTDKFCYRYTLYNDEIEHVKSMCDIGVIIQSNLKFTLHCNSLIKKAHFQIKNLFNTFRNHSYKFYINLYTCYI